MFFANLLMLESGESENHVTSTFIKVFFANFFILEWRKCIYVETSTTFLSILNNLRVNESFKNRFDQNLAQATLWNVYCLKKHYIVD